MIMPARDDGQTTVTYKFLVPIEDLDPAVLERTNPTKGTDNIRVLIDAKDIAS